MACIGDVTGIQKLDAVEITGTISGIDFLHAGLQYCTEYK
jgi:hypothetical protein